MRYPATNSRYGGQAFMVTAEECDFIIIAGNISDLRKITKRYFPNIKLDEKRVRKTITIAAP